MTAAVTPIAALARETTLERIALRKANDKVSERQKALAEHHAAVGRAASYVSDSEQAITEAEAALEAAREADKRALENAIVAGRDRPPSGVPAARTRLEALRDAAVDAADIVERIRADNEAAVELELARLDALLARVAVVRPLLQTKISEIAAARRLIAENRQICGGGLLPDDFHRSADGNDQRITNKQNELFAATKPLRDALENALAVQVHVGHEQIAVWRRWKATLLSDANAPSPEAP
jgi:hypothetical protein